MWRLAQRSCSQGSNKSVGDVDATLGEFMDSGHPNEQWGWLCQIVNRSVVELVLNVRKPGWVVVVDSA
jgi:hypothetical protein